jgi:23S rRNA (pseudouridine1915-N3)-methyltransferase
MQISILAVGKKMPDWVQSAVSEYTKRLRQEYAFEVLEIPSSGGGKNSNKERGKHLEAKAILAKIKTSDHVIALDVAGQRRSTRGVAEELAKFKLGGGKVKFLIGGADGLHTSCLQRAQECWSLSDLTFTHSMARVILSEQLYRADSILRGHPYHRD